jgi:hypothetical protein
MSIAMVFLVSEGAGVCQVADLVMPAGYFKPLAIERTARLEPGVRRIDALPAFPRHFENALAANQFDRVTDVIAALERSTEAAQF